MREPVGHVLSKINNDPTGQGWYIHSCEGEYKLGPIEMLKIAIWITNRWVDELLKIEQWGITLTVPMAFVMPDDWNHTSIDWDEKTLSGQNSRVARRECFVVPKGSDLPSYMLHRATVTCREGIRRNGSYYREIPLFGNTSYYRYDR